MIANSMRRITTRAAVTARSTVAPRAIVSPRIAMPMTSLIGPRMYHQKVLDHYNSPRNAGSLPKSDPDVGVGLVGAPACGDVLKLSIRVDTKGRISECKFKTFGCGSAIASSSYVTELIKGMTLEEAAKVKNTVIAKELCLPPVKLHCSMLAEDAVAAALKDYYHKNPGVKQGQFEVDVDRRGFQPEAVPAWQELRDKYYNTLHRARDQ